MQHRATNRAAREDETAEGRQRRFELVDRRLERFDTRRPDDALLDAGRNAMPWIGQPRADRKQVTLDCLEEVGQIGRCQVCASHPEPSRQFIDIAVRRHAGIGLRHTRSIEETGVSGVARTSVNAGVRSRVHGWPTYYGTVPRAKKPPRLPDPTARRWFRRQLLTWYRRNGRDLPWRQTSDPYDILVSEVMLQQTQVDRVLPKYHEWLERYPSFAALADAPEHDVVRTWYPLGYNIRPRRLHAIARDAVARFDGQLPDDEATLLSFKGIGAYTAGAVMSFAFGKRAAILDTNVARVLFRVFVGRGAPDSHAMKKALWAVSWAVLPHRHVFDFNQALMDFGATLCSARAPKCEACPMSSRCHSYPFKAPVRRKEKPPRA